MTDRQQHISVFGKNGPHTVHCLARAVLWSELITLRSKASAQDPVFPSRSGKSLDCGRVRMIVRQAAKRVGIAEAISPHLAAPLTWFSRP
jgi:site-specific recombinase XerD